MGEQSEYRDEAELFMNDDSFNLDVDYARSYQKQDTNFNVKLYRVNVVESQVDDLYGEALASEKKLFSPVELNVLLTLSESQQFYMAEQGIVREDIGDLTFTVFLNELKDKNVDIVRGDFVSYNASGNNERFFEIVNANNVYDSTNRTIAGKKPIYRKIIAKPVKEDVVLNFD